MPDRPILKAIRHAPVRFGSRIRDIVRGASGLLAYEHYLAHLRASHPEIPPMSREQFFRADLTARWQGVRRCC
jgi:uncharacterized short protein YbdD (DUF466 family)